MSATRLERPDLAFYFENIYLKADKVTACHCKYHHFASNKITTLDPAAVKGFQIWHASMGTETMGHARTLTEKCVARAFFQLS